MNMTKKGIKMNISKCLKNYEFKKSEELTTKIRKQHEITNGYKFIDDENNESQIFITWCDDNLDIKSKSEIIEKIYNILDRHGFFEYIEFEKDKAQIIVNNFKE